MRFKLILSALFVCLMSFSAWAEDFTFDNKQTYSICYRLNDVSFSLIQEATIEKEGMLGGKGILVFVSKNNFSVEDSKGFIMMDSVIAILPSEQAYKQRDTFCRPLVRYHGDLKNK